VTPEPRPGSEERQLALLVRSATEYAIFMLNPEGYVQTWNAGAERLKGYAPKEIIGKHFSTFYTPEDLARDHPAEELRLALRDGRYAEEGWRVRKDGSRFWANIVITAIYEDGELIGFGKVSRDLTVRRLGEEQTRARALELEAVNRELFEYRRLVAGVRDYAIFMLDPAGHILSWNLGAERLKGYAPEEIIGKHFSTFYTPEDLARDHPAWELEVAIREGRYEEEGWRVRKDGTHFWANVTITAIRDDDGRLTGFAKVTRDLTERRAAEEELRLTNERLAAANRELDQFATVAAHDMVSPLLTIRGFADRILRPETSSQQIERYAGFIRTSSDRLTNMLQALLAYARAGTDEVEGKAVDILAVIDQVLMDLGAAIGERRVDIRVEVPSGAAVTASENDLHAVLQNLIGNAVKFSGEEPRVTIRADASIEAWTVSVEDNGPGVSAADQERIFDAFERGYGASRMDGSGLGLAICQRLVERHGGAIGVDSAPDRGSRFWFTLPANRPPGSDPVMGRRTATDDATSG
jgi:PAS domain S-box-containing protein